MFCAIDIRNEKTFMSTIPVSLLCFTVKINTFKPLIILTESHTGASHPLKEIEESFSICLQLRSKKFSTTELYLVANQATMFFIRSNRKFQLIIYL